MKITFKNRKGMTLVTVMIIMTVLVILCAILAETVMQTLVLTKRHRNVDLAYYAGESAIENWTSVIASKISGSQDIGDDYPDGPFNLTDLGSAGNYGKWILKEKVLLSDLENQLIDIEGKASSVAAVPVSSSATVVAKDIEYVGVENDTSGDSNTIIVKLGIKGEATYSSTSAYKAGNKVVYAVKPFKVYCPKASELEGAIYTVGDFYVNKSNVTVKGDVFTFGSHPLTILSTNQHYYGGIYAKTQSKLAIYGNAYSRSYIRAGQYKDTVNDDTNIFIYKDAIAQCVQSFGHNDKTAILRNAYTFDDLEINGNNSIIAVNGSYFGLSKGGRSHDDSSAIVNSATIHQDLNPDSFNSRVSINGDVIVGGSTMKVIPGSGLYVGDIEDASLAYRIEADLITKIPYYKFWPDWDNIGKGKSIENYHMDLRTLAATAAFDGRLNQFQVFPIVNPLAVGFSETVITDWLSKIENDTYTITPKATIKGFSNYEMVGNNRLYKNTLTMPEGTTDGPSTYDDTFFVKNNNPADPNYKLGLYKLDNIFSGNQPKYYGETCWDMTKYKDPDDPGGNPFSDNEKFLFGSTSTEGKCKEISNELMGKTHKFAVRNYPTGAALDDKTPWVVEDSFEFDKILKSISGKTDSSYVLYLTAPKDGADPFDKTKPHDISNLFKYNGKIKEITDWGTGADLYTRCNNSRNNVVTGDTEYFVFANPDPEVNISISGTFNGIIVTAGKVILENGASVYGSIIAGGGGYETGPKGEFIPKAKAIGDYEYPGLNNGEYAALFVKDSSAYVDFFLGLAGNDADALNETHILGIVDKARKTTIGNLNIPSDLDITIPKDRDKILVYLNKAARINLLEKFTKKGINLYDIF